jgi:hypothetical protein
MFFRAARLDEGHDVFKVTAGVYLSLSVWLHWAEGGGAVTASGPSTFCGAIYNPLGSWFGSRGRFPLPTVISLRVLQSRVTLLL